ncbi:hypothetical protein [Acidithiobacillus ferrooxidans]|uniref:hypothetical protein n=1 Tax=Acidithiobacillus ferrooxidans TaxID=920 RepID=UPI0015E89DE5|nr:hypothetical protein [Acidithiobacillus ferrooxidans]
MGSRTPEWVSTRRDNVAISHAQTRRQQGHCPPQQDDDRRMVRQRMTGHPVLHSGQQPCHVRVGNHDVRGCRCRQGCTRQGCHWRACVLMRKRFPEFIGFIGCGNRRVGNWQIFRKAPLRRVGTLRGAIRLQQEIQAITDLRKQAFDMGGVALRNRLPLCPPGAAPCKVLALCKRLAPCGGRPLCICRLPLSRRGGSFCHQLLA